MCISIDSIDYNGLIVAAGCHRYVGSQLAPYPVEMISGMMSPGVLVDTGDYPNELPDILG